jgi:signal transduction histidine kinase
MNHSDKLPSEVTMRLRLLAHDLSNSLETLLQASYLLNQADLKPDIQKWVRMIDSASQEATRINREIREILRAQSPQ